MKRFRVGDGMNHAEWAEQTHVRIARTLSHFEWASSRDLFDAMGVTEDRDDREHVRFAGALSLMVKRGDVVTRGTRGVYDYRLAKAPPVPPPLPPPLPEEGDEEDGRVYLGGRWQSILSLGPQAAGKRCPNGHALNVKNIVRTGRQWRCGRCVSLTKRAA